MCQHVFSHLPKILFPILLSFQHKPITYSKSYQFYSNKAASKEWLKVHLYNIDLSLSLHLGSTRSTVERNGNNIIRHI